MRGKIKLNNQGVFRIEVPKQKFYPKGFALTKQHKNKWCEFEVDKEAQVLSITIEATQEKLTPLADLLATAQAADEEKRREADRKKSQKEFKEKHEAMLARQEQSKDSYELFETFVPTCTKNTLLDDPDNFHLKLNKLAYFDKKEGKFKFFETKGGKLIRKIKPNFGHFNFAQNCQKHLALAKGLCAEVTPYSMPVDGRLVVGLGQASVYETSMTLHHVYGIPYIPASSIKGVVRSWVIRSQYLEDTEANTAKHGSQPSEGEAEKLALQDKTFCDVFGGDEESMHKEARQGKVVFFDAFPCAEPTLEVDIMNPHYSDYYSEKPRDAKVAPADYHNPIPLPFLTVGRQTAGAKSTPLKFQFVLGIRQSTTTHQKLLAQAATWLKQALTQQGIGAKTAVGYGYMSG
ncbi:type III-B CRISPR module RAMP protein Cmr6 [uncultured Microscilla sp.]|uniref:type III-B CRISPR module RAMP protein Cmr6 n=1 Tax=uncultured Microscilla sp. TaxID=432653 RepID=UPI00262DF24E|nr:type III-B CRISPR module RAMP protein Cmr6 [uncultured Microscilla sp.]